MLTSKPQSTRSPALLRTAGHVSRKLKLKPNSKPAYLLALKRQYAVGSAAGFQVRSVDRDYQFSGN
jgi:hypothetical protein